MMKKTFKVEGMHCTSCAMVIEGELEDAGVEARCNYARETLEVEFEQAKVSEEKIRDVVAKAGYTLAP